MDLNITEPQFPLEERIGNPDLLVERGAEFADYHRWIQGIPRKISQSQAILARKKSGKTAFVQRLFNQIWTANGPVIPFYIEIPATKTWLPELALLYYRSFASQYISFLERNPRLMRQPLELDEIKAYGEAHDIESLVNDVVHLKADFADRLFGGMWERAYTAPHRLPGSTTSSSW